ncbi:DUF7133 domain-containing protein [Humisphaera borealis]|uniref:HEAT repeat domain-containing protein n=1 Tax=Humisphaera borealis TaxID=2807512 RepID=A0A7M2WWV1_9BACT|nr:HEAT repeat domain-containing protein [Humisphaera borealis]QOV89311.1 HEAT repeat domain-containing protein [Humisphaera borealis]
MPAVKPLRRAVACVAVTLLAATPFVIRAADGEDDPNASKAATKPTMYVAPASDEGEAAIKQFSMPKGWKAELFAAEPRLANPVCLSIDDKGRVYVVETFRRRNSVLDIRKLPDWLDEDLSLRNVQQRIDMVKRRMPDTWQSLEGLSERVRLIEDSNGDGIADKDTVFATGFDKLEHGTAAGVLPVGDSVFFASIPALWKLKDTNNDGVADQKDSVYYGFGVRFAYSGHDFHGLTMGPDGRLYFSIADRGVHIEKDGKVLIDNPDSGCVMRCEPDGSNLELVHTGLRNPQELAFDEYGNLFTADNNSDGGDPTRWVYVVEGGNSGWHVGWQWHTNPVSRGAWLGEDLCQVNPKIPAYYRLPPIATPKIAGPAGLTYTPGTGMPTDWQNRFLLVDFRGGAAGGSGVYALKNKPMGASFELEEVKELVTGVLPTDVTFGPDGRIYFTDWVTGWEPHGKGRIYAITPPGQDAKQVAEVKQILSFGFLKRSEEELADFLEHPDVRVRQGAQFALVNIGDTNPGEKGFSTLAAVAKANENPLARIHAIWGLGQIARKTPGDSPAAAALLPLLADSDPEIRAQAARKLGDAKVPEAVAPLINIIKRDRNVRTQAFAAAALGKLKAKDAVDPVLAMLKKQSDRDAYLRHAGVMALVGINDPAALEKTADDAVPSVRVAALLAYRKQHDAKVAKFLDDVDTTLVLEAARAINDETLDAAMPQLAAAIIKQGLSEPILYRVLNANYRLGTAETAKALATFAARSDVPTPTRVEALKMLAAWKDPNGKDRVTGLWRPVPPRGNEPAKSALVTVLDKLLAEAPDSVRIAALNASTALGVNTTPLIDLVRNEKNPPGLRAAAVAAMVPAKDKKLADGASLALASQESALRLAGIRVQANLPGGSKTLTDLLVSGTPAEQQAVVQTAAAMMAGKTASKDGETVLKLAFDRLTKGALPVEAHLDLLTAAATKKSGKLSDAYKAFDGARKKKVEADPLALHRETLAGGDAERGAYIFRERADVSCLRCHAINKVGGNAGPDLAGLLARAGGTEKGREYILESILYPSKKIAEGWETVSIKTTDDEVIAGVLKAETATELTLEVPNVGPMKLAKSKVKSRQGGLSGMPDDISKTLSKEDIRDLVEFLAK